MSKEVDTAETTAAQNLKISFNTTAIDQGKIESRLRRILTEFGFQFVISGGGPVNERDMLFERDLCPAPED